MQIPSLILPTSPEDAIAVQHALAQQVRLKNASSPRDLIAGIDVSYDIASNQSFAFAVLMRRDALVPIASVRAVLPTAFPYIPGLLSFREIPVILEALKKLPYAPDLLMVDGQGVAHPRRLGIAAHLGVLVNIPTIGVGKSKLCGRYEMLGEEPGAQQPLIHRGEQIGTVLRSKKNCQPLFISPGHLFDQETALSITKECITRYRLPEPTRIADKISKTEKAEQSPTLFSNNHMALLS